MKPIILIPAAGRSARMLGEDKLLQSVEGDPLLRRQIVRARSTGCDVLVCLPLNADARLAAVRDLDIETTQVADADEGMGATLRHGARMLAAKGAPMMVLLPDVPGIRARDIELVLRAFAKAPGTPVRASDDEGRPGTPLVVPATLVSDFTKLTGDDGGRSVLADTLVTLLPLPDDRATRDLDTPEAWAAWRKETGILR